MGVADSPPCITARRGGCVINKMSRSYRNRHSRAGFPLCFQSDNHPGLAVSGGFARFYDSLGHPSLRSCKEGNLLVRNVSTFFTPYRPRLQPASLYDITSNSSTRDSMRASLAVAVAIGRLLT